MPAKTDFKKTLDGYRATQGEFRVVDIPAMQYLMISGRGDPNTSEEFADAITSLFPVAYKLKFASKLELDRDYVVPPLEALWWSSDMDAFTVSRDKTIWEWTAMIMTPEWITTAMFRAAVAKAAASGPPSLEKVSLEPLHEGTCVQTLHVGSFDDESAVLAEMHDHVIPSRGMRMTGKHHEIYFSDFRRTAPAKLRTILRQPVTPAS